jgi:hypothetical protein
MHVAALDLADRASVASFVESVKQWTINPGTARKLWMVSLDLIGPPATP